MTPSDLLFRKITQRMDSRDKIGSRETDSEAAAAIQARDAEGDRHSIDVKA